MERREREETVYSDVCFPVRPQTLDAAPDEALRTLTDVYVRGLRSGPL